MVLFVRNLRKMPPHQIGTHPKCASKIRYHSEAAAAVATETMNLRFEKPSRPYWCESCGYWHLTTK
jgi:hypothetical protein